ncbi:MAG: hypothetical protein R3E10_17120 [Gemmatimonadota bacterium]
MPRRQPTYAIRYVDPSHPEEAWAPALVAGGIAAVVGGALWSVVMAVSPLGLDVLAVGIGVLVGVAMAAATAARRAMLSATAALLTLVGILTGMLLTVQMSPDLGVSRMIVDDADALAGVAFWKLQRTHQVPEGTLRELEALGPADTVPDLLWAEMLTLGHDHVRSLDPDAREALAREFTEGFIREGGALGRLRTETDLLDLLWGLVAMAAAAWLAGRARESSPAGGP